MHKVIFVLLVPGGLAISWDTLAFYAILLLIFVRPSVRRLFAPQYA